jgi:hypothetical protein
MSTSRLQERQLVFSSQLGSFMQRLFLLIHNIELSSVPVTPLALYKHHAAITNIAHSTLAATIKISW